MKPDAAVLRICNEALQENGPYHRSPGQFKHLFHPLYRLRATRSYGLVLTDVKAKSPCTDPLSCRGANGDAGRGRSDMNGCSNNWRCSDLHAQREVGGQVFERMSALR